MIRKITIENYYSVKEKQVIDFLVPKNAPESENFLLSRTGDGDRLPAVVGFYGPNASGKTTVLRALDATARFITKSFEYALESSIPDFWPFMHQDYWLKPTKISIEFDAYWLVPEKELSPESVEIERKLGNLPKSHNFLYELHIAHDGKGFNDQAIGSVLSGEKPIDHVSFEALYWYPKGRLRKLFERKGQNISFSKELNILPNDPRIKMVKPNSSVISTFAQFNHFIFKKIQHHTSFQTSNVIARDSFKLTSKNYFEFYFNNKNALDSLNRQLQRIDIGLKEMMIETTSNGLIARFKHDGLSQDIYWFSESSGTRSFVENFPLLWVALETGSIATIDELESNLHPILVSEIVQWFYDKDINKYRAQLLFTAHNASFLQDLEKEQVFFTEKYANGETKIYGAKDIQGLRREPDLAKKYMAGVLGAIPNIG
ncbi:MAG: ATP-binding protein [Alphaproteobacteria bacterium]|nr:ATP-binding protein [Alphaproteobacteria bacterium]